MKKIYIISNFNTNPYLKDILKREYHTNYTITNIFINDNIDIINNYSFEEESHVIIFLSMDIVYLNKLSNEKKIYKYYLSIIKSILKKIAQTININVSWIGFDGLYFDNLIPNFKSIRLKEIIEKLNYFIINNSYGIKYINLEEKVVQLGFLKAYNKINYFRFNNIYTKEIFKSITRDIISKTETKKYIFLDCDNVLWRGIIAENTKIIYKNENFGRLHSIFRDYIKQLYHKGIILFIISKNKKADILKMFNNLDDFSLLEENFVEIVCNYNDKAYNISYLIKKYNLDVNNIIFIDDDEFEIKNVDYYFPQITTIRFNYDIFDELNYYFGSNIINYNSKKLRNKTYKILGLLSEQQNRPQFQVKIRKTRDNDLNRIKELCFRAKRFTIKKENKGYELYKDPNYNVVSLFYKALNINFGLVGFIVIDKKHKKVCEMVLSCRVYSIKLLEYIKFFLIKESVKFIDYEYNGYNDIIIDYFKNIFTSNA